jgi:hypothetical protein
MDNKSRDKSGFNGSTQLIEIGSGAGSRPPRKEKKEAMTRSPLSG